MKLLIGADVVPTESNEDLFREGNAEALLGESLCTVLRSADVRIFNLEVPLTDTASPIDKCGPNLIAPTQTVKGYQAMGVDLLTLANNHILDQGTQGLDATLACLRSSGIAYLGAGATPQEAAAPYVFSCGGKKIGVYACSEHEFSIVGQNTPGANPFDALETPDHVARLKAECDYVIVLYHGGKEHYLYPSPNLQKVCRKLAEKGADLVLCQHSHCIGCHEEYMGGTIVYGQGNFLFDRSNSEYWQTGLLVQIAENFTVSYIPVVKKDNVVRLAEAGQAEQILNAFETRSEEIKDSALLEEKYAAFASAALDDYLMSLSGLRRNLLFRIVNKLTGHRFMHWIIRKKYRKNDLLAIRNYIECEAHEELLLSGLGGRQH